MKMGVKDAPIKMHDISESEIPALLLQLAARLLSGDRQPQNGPMPDRLLDLREAAAKLNVSPSWLYRRSAKLSFAVRNGRKLSFSEKGIEDYIRQKMGKGVEG
jgi:predicted DNA-binding transcriptional regulator AlpA